MLLTACGFSEAGAQVACENFLEQRVGQELEFEDPGDVESSESGGVWTVSSFFIEPNDGTATNYVCQVEEFEDEQGSGWRLVDLTSDRL